MEMKPFGSLYLVLDTMRKGIISLSNIPEEKNISIQEGPNLWLFLCNSHFSFFSLHETKLVESNTDNYC